MSDDLTDAKRFFWQVAVGHAEFLRSEGFSSNGGFFADRFAEMTEKAESFREEFRKNWDGVHYEDFQEVEERRRSYHEDERSPQLRQLWRQMLALPEGDPEAQLALSDLDHPVNRQIFRKAKHDTSKWQLQDLRDVRDESVVELNVYCLLPEEIDELGRRALGAARHGIALEVLDEVSHYLGGYETYEANRKTVLGSPAEIAEAVQAQQADRPRAERVDIAMRDYRLHPAYDGKTDERSVRKALHQAFTRRDQ